MEDSMQTRGDDDLFSDEITPITQTQQAELEAQRSQTTRHNELADQVQKLNIQQGPNRGRGNGRGRGWQRGHGPVQIQHQQVPKGPLIVGGPDTFPGRRKTPAPKEKPTQSARAIKVAELRRRGLEASKYANTARRQSQAEQEVNEESKEPAQEDQQQQQIETIAQEDESSEAQTKPKVAAVRGDRTNTGGVRQPKLTEEELSARVAAAKAKSQSRAAAHARAQADADDFAERERAEHVRRSEEEKLAQMKRAQDEAQARYLGQERERNRVRKLGAQTGREWDAQKDEIDFQAPRYGDRTRYGEAQEQDLSIYEWKEPHHHNEYNGNGESSRGDYNGRGRGRGRGRGGPKPPYGPRVRTRKWPKMELGLEKKDPNDFPPLPRKGDDMPIADPAGEMKRVMEAADRERKAKKEAEAAERERVLRDAEEYRTSQAQKTLPVPVTASANMEDFNAERAKRAAQALEDLQRSVQSPEQAGGGSWADQMANDGT